MRLCRFWAANNAVMKIIRDEMLHRYSSISTRMASLTMRRLRGLAAEGKPPRQRALMYQASALPIGDDAGLHAHDEPPSCGQLGGSRCGSTAINVFSIR